MKLLEEQPRRMAKEKHLLEEYARTSAGIRLDGWAATEQGGIALKFRLKLLHTELEGQLVYPALFPDVPAFVRPRKAGESWTRHQYAGSGVLCLEFGPDNWHQGITGVDLIRSTNKLLWGESLAVVLPSAPAVESRHAQTVGQIARFYNRRFVVTEAFAHAAKDAHPSRPTALKTITTTLGDESVTVVTVIGEGPDSRISDVPETIASQGGALEGRLVQVDSTATWSAAIDIGDLHRHLGDAWHGGDANGAPTVLVVRDSQGGYRAFSLCEGEAPTIFEYKVLDFSDSRSVRLPPEYRKHAKLSVAIVGLGSLGSKIAASLARAGIRHFILFDDDVLRPENLVRSELDWNSVGFMKVNAVAQRIQSIAPDALVVPLPSRVAGQENPDVAGQYLSYLAGLDMVIDATANSTVFTALAAACKRLRIPMVWGELFGGGGGAMMARSRPGHEASPLEIRTRIFDTLESFPTAPGKKAKDYALLSADRVLVGSDADVGALAASMTQFAIDTVNPEGPSAYPYAAYLIGYRKFWIFKQPFDTIPIDCSNAATDEAAEEQLSPDEESAVAELATSIEKSHAADNGSS